MGESTTNTVTLDTLVSVFSQFMTWILGFITTIASNPLLLLGIAAFVAAVIIRLAYKAIHGRG